MHCGKEGVHPDKNGLPKAPRAPGTAGAPKGFGTRTSYQYGSQGEEPNRVSVGFKQKMYMFTSCMVCITPAGLEMRVASVVA